MNWLITGGIGFIGRNLIASLMSQAGRNDRFLVLDNLSANTLDDMREVAEIASLKVVSPLEPMWPNQGRDVHVVIGDIRDAALVEKAAEGADVLVHLAANTGVAPSVENPRADCETNIIGTLNCLEAARKHGVGRFVFASSGAPAGVCEPPIHELMPARPASPYGASKLAGEGYCSAYYNSFGIQTVSLRFSNVYGPYSGRKGSVVAAVLRRALSGKPVDVFGDGTQTRDFIYVEDLVRAIQLGAGNPGIGGEVFQIGTGVETSVNQLVDKLQTHLAAAGLPAIVVQNPPPRIGDVPRNFADRSKAKAMLGWEPRTSLDDGLRKTVAWFAAKAR